MSGRLGLTPRAVHSRTTASSTSEPSPSAGTLVFDTGSRFHTIVGVPPSGPDLPGESIKNWIVMEIGNVCRSAEVPYAFRRALIVCSGRWTLLSLGLLAEPGFSSMT